MILARHLDTGHNDYEITPEGIVIHYISGRYTQPDDPYDPDEIIRILTEYRFGYHYLIARDGIAYELVPPPLRAWHAGESRWNGRGDCNSWMLGIALAGMHGEPFTAEQYDALAQRTGELVTQYPIEKRNIVGHEDVAPNRKKDPGPSFEWPRYMDSINGFWRQ